ncbi:MAG: hypothetical protein ACXAEX_11100 [Promethearchaeota archaeon]|jgi:hypothetical protein
MSKAVSYYDWGLSFKKKVDTKPDNDITINSIGMSTNSFKDFVKKWKEKNIL